MVSFQISSRAYKLPWDIFSGHSGTHVHLQEHIKGVFVAWQVYRVHVKLNCTRKLCMRASLFAGIEVTVLYTHHKSNIILFCSLRDRNAICHVNLHLNFPTLPMRIHIFFCLCITIPLHSCYGTTHTHIWYPYIYTKPSLHLATAPPFK